MGTRSSKRNAILPIAKVRGELRRRRNTLRTGRGLSPADRYFELWQWIILQLAEELASPGQDGTAARLERLSAELEQAQARGDFPAELVREITEERPHGPARAT